MPIAGAQALKEEPVLETAVGLSRHPKIQVDKKSEESLTTAVITGMVTTRKQQQEDHHHHHLDTILERQQPYDRCNDQNDDNDNGFLPVLSNRENFRAISKHPNFEISDHGRVRKVKNGEIRCIAFLFHGD